MTDTERAVFDAAVACIHAEDARDQAEDDWLRSITDTGIERNRVRLDRALINLANARLRLVNAVRTHWTVTDQAEAVTP